MLSRAQRLHFAVRFGRVHLSPGVSPSCFEQRRHIGRGTRTSSSSSSSSEAAAGEAGAGGEAAGGAGEAAAGDGEAAAGPGTEAGGGGRQTATAAAAGAAAAAAAAAAAGAGTEGAADSGSRKNTRLLAAIQMVLRVLLTSQASLLRFHAGQSGARRGTFLSHGDIRYYAC